MAVQRLVELSLRLPGDWFPVPLGPEADLLDWAGSTAFTAWRRRADAGVPEEAVLPDAGRRLVVELVGLAHNLREQLGAGARSLCHASVWIPVPEAGVVTALVVAQITSSEGDRTPERYLETLEAASLAQPGAGQLHAQRLETELRGVPVRGLHSMTGILDPAAGVAAFEERTCFGLFPENCADMAEVLFLAERPAAFEDMPTQTLALLEGLELGTAEAA